MDLRDKEELKAEAPIRISTTKSASQITPASSSNQSRSRLCLRPRRLPLPRLGPKEDSTRLSWLRFAFKPGRPVLGNHHRTPEERTEKAAVTREVQTRLSSTSSSTPHPDVPNDSSTLETEEPQLEELSQTLLEIGLTPEISAFLEAYLVVTTEDLIQWSDSPDLSCQETLSSSNESLTSSSK